MVRTSFNCLPTLTPGGVRWDDADTAVSLADSMGASSVSIDFQGVYCHDGDSYHCRGVNEIKTAGDRSTDRLLELVDK